VRGLPRLHAPGIVPCIISWLWVGLWLEFMAGFGVVFRS